MCRLSPYFWKPCIIVREILNYQFMKINKLFIAALVLASAAITSCCGSHSFEDSRQEMELIKVNFNSPNPKESLSWSDVVSSVKYINLSEGQNATIGNISSVRVTDNRIYVQDNPNKQLLVYDLDGNYLMKIQRQGRGPGEYVSLTQFDVNETTGEITIMDLPSRKLLVYSDSGEFVRSISFVENDDVPRDFALLENGDYVFYSPDYNKGTDHYGIWQGDSLGVEVKRIYEIPEKYRFSAGIFPKYFHHLGNKVYVRGREFDGTLYHIGSDTYTTPYKLDVDIRLSGALKRTEQRTSQIKEDFYIIFQYLETDKWVYIQLYDMETPVVVFYNKAEKKPYYITEDNLMLEDMPKAGAYMTATDDAFVGVLPNTSGEGYTISLSYVK